MKSPKQALNLVMTLLAITTSAWYYTYQKPPLFEGKKVSNLGVDTIITNLDVVKFNDKGELINKLSTPMMQHFPKEDQNLLETPHITIIQDGNPPWEISSKKALSVNSLEKIIFTQNVVVHQNAANKTPESTLNTEELTYYPKENKATSTLFVSFKQSGTQIDATGMNAYLDKQRVELLHEARATYVPNNQG